MMDFPTNECLKHLSLFVFVCFFKEKKISYLFLNICCIVFDAANYVQRTSFVHELWSCKYFVSINM